MKFNLTNCFIQLGIQCSFLLTGIIAVCVCVFMGTIIFRVLLKVTLQNVNLHFLYQKNFVSRYFLSSYQD